MKQKFEKKCKNCGKIFITFDKSVEFCNLGCKEDYANPPMGPIPEAKRTKLLEKKCVVCGKVYLTKRYDKIYCSNKCGNKAFRDRERGVEEIKKDDIKQEPTRNPVTHNYIDLRIDFENQLEQFKKARNDCIESKKKSKEIISWLTPKIELLDDVINQMKKCEFCDIADLGKKEQIQKESNNEA